MGPVRVLQVVAELGMGGIQSFLMNVYRNIDREQIQFDFLLNMDKKGVFEDEIENMGGHIYRVTSRNISFTRNKKELEQFFQEHTEYKCIHCHFSNLSYLMPLKIVAKYDVPTRIIHSHSTHLPSNPIHKVIHEYNVIVNCTPLGMYPHSDCCPNLPYEAMDEKTILYDLIYNPDETLFMYKGRQQGATVKNGLEMLLLQAFASWELWHSQD